MRPIPFKYTFDVVKAEERPDGLFLIGEASGPEIDATNERMAPQAITRFAAQITTRAEAGDPIPYRDAHATDGVFQDLGELTNAWIDERFHLGVEVKLDEDSPAALYLWKKITRKGKKYGMSIAGTVLDFVDEFVASAGREIRTYKEILLSEISNTTRPAWTPSFGTVLSKAIDEAHAESIATQGENVDLEKDALAAGDSTDAPADDVEKDAETVEETETVTEKADEETVEETETEKAEGDEPETEKTDDEESAEDDVEKASDDQNTDPAGDTESDTTSADDATEKSDDAPAADEAPEADATEKAADGDESEDIEKAGRSFSAANAKRLRALYAHITSELKALGLLDEDAPAKSDSPDAETDLTKALEAEKATLAQTITELQQALTEKTARITELENMPAVAAPDLVTKADEAEEARQAIAKMSPLERLRLGLSLAHSE